jgi:hypothetical protein
MLLFCHGVERRAHARLTLSDLPWPAAARRVRQQPAWRWPVSVGALFGLLVDTKKCEAAETNSLPSIETRATMRYGDACDSR